MGKILCRARRFSLNLVFSGLLAGCGGGGPAPPAVAAIVLDASTASATSIRMSWTASTAGSRYRIYRDGTLLDTVSGASRSVSDTGLQSGSRHCYRITAVDGAGAAVADSNQSCAATAPLASWAIQRVSASPPVSQALDAQGLDRMSFCGPRGVQFQASRADGSFSTVSLDPAAACFDALLVVGGDGSDHIVYADTNSDQLKYATDVSGQWVVSVIPGAAGAEFPSLAIDRGDAVHVAYLLFTGHSPGAYQLMYASDASGSWQSTLVEDTLAYPSLAVDAAGTPHIAYLGAMRADGGYPVHYRSYASGAWIDEVAAVSADPKSLVALAVTPAGRPQLVYKSLAELDYVTQVSGRWTTTRVDSFDAGAADYGRYGAYDVSLDLDSAGGPHLAYEDSSGDLKYAVLEAGRWGTVYVDTEGTQNQIKMDPGGHARIAYAGADNLYSKLAVSP